MDLAKLPAEELIDYRCHAETIEDFDCYEDAIDQKIGDREDDVVELTQRLMKTLDDFLHLKGELQPIFLRIRAQDLAIVAICDLPPETSVLPEDN